MFFPLAPDDRNQAPRNAALDEGGACGAAASTSALGGASCEHSVGGGNGHFIKEKTFSRRSPPLHRRHRSPCDRNSLPRGVESRT